MCNYSIACLLLRTELRITQTQLHESAQLKSYDFTTARICQGERGVFPKESPRVPLPQSKCQPAAY